MADEFGVAVVITNQVVAKVDAMAFGPTTAPIGGACQTHPHKPTAHGAAGGAASSHPPAGHARVVSPAAA
jgi:hypothetical protein